MKQRLPETNSGRVTDQVEAGRQEGRRVAVDCDLKSFFNSVIHDRLMGSLREKVRDPLALGLIRRYLLALGIPRDEVKMVTRSRKGYWRMSYNSIVQRALTNDLPHDQGVPDMSTSWMVLHYGPKARV